MSKKIINGIDLSECEKLGETIDGFTCGLGKRIRFANEIITKHNLCKDNPNCDFKQLKHLQEENEDLKLRNENLRLALSSYKMPEVIKVLTDWRTGELQLQENKLKTYKQALEEIREKCLNKMCNICDNIDGTTYLDDCNLICEYCKIVKLINEVLNEQK